MNKFSTLGLSDSLLEVLAKIGFEEPTPIQEKAIPLLLSQEPIDFIGLAQTGTGKTAAFGLPLLDLIDQEDTSTQALIMAPTRELGQQTAKQLSEFAANQRALNVECVYGGSNISTQIRALKKPVQILVATPGRLLDLMRRKAVNLNAVRFVVLDEADEMLQMGFKEDIDEILSHTPENRVTWLFSATMPKEIRKIVKKYMDSPEEVHVNAEQRTNIDITHQYVVTTTSDKLIGLRRFLDLHSDMKGVMFCRTRRETQQIADELGDQGYSAEALHGDLSQAQRDAVMKRFKNRSMQLLVATDVAARGIDVNDLTHVIHHTLPDQLESYTHRAGRTARAGKKGISLAFINSREGRKIEHLEKKIGISFERVMVPNIEEVKALRIENWAKGLLKSETLPEADAVLQRLGSYFEGWTKEELLKRLISRQIERLSTSHHEAEDINVVPGKSNRTRSNSSANRYFINVGSLDGLTQRDLTEFLSEVSQVPEKSFSGISIQKSCAFFDLDKSEDKNFSDLFKGIIVEGRKIRVNRDDVGNKPKRARGSKYDEDRRGKGPTGRRSGRQPDNTRSSNRQGGKSRSKYKGESKRRYRS
ncbi:MAG: DEAD/DEAH box helicase [Flavobacteriales bacterium]|nr:DEAD/DEAH box helicase [Flavobacteriales bacterium]